MKYKISFTKVLDLQQGEPNTAWFPCNSWFSIWRSMIQNWSFLVPLKQLVLHLEIYDTRILFTIVLDLKHGEPNAAWFPCNSWFSIWRSMIRNWSFLVPLKQLVLHLEIHDIKMKYMRYHSLKYWISSMENLTLLGSLVTVGSLFGDPWYKIEASLFPWNSWFSIWRSMILKWNIRYYSLN